MSKRLTSKFLRTQFQVNKDRRSGQQRREYYDVLGEGTGLFGSIQVFTIRVSVILSDRSLLREEQKKFCQKLFPMNIDSRAS